MKRAMSLACILGWVFLATQVASAADETGEEVTDKKVVSFSLTGFG